MGAEPAGREPCRPTVAFGATVLDGLKHNPISDCINNSEGTLLKADHQAILRHVSGKTVIELL